MDDISSLDDTASLDDDSSMEEALSLDDSLSLDDMLSLEPLPESETDETNLSAEEETGGEEKELVLDDFGLNEDAAPDEDAALDEDTTLDMDDFKMDSGISQEDNLAKVIPEAFETGTGAEANIPFDDDLEAFTDEDISLDDSDKEESLAAKAEKVNEKENGLSSEIKEEVKKVLSYMDHLLESLPEEKIEEFAKSEHFDTYKKLFKELGLV